MKTADTLPGPPCYGFRLAECSGALSFMPFKKKRLAKKGIQTPTEAARNRDNPKRGQVGRGFTIKRIRKKEPRDEQRQKKWTEASFQWQFVFA